MTDKIDSDQDLIAALLHFHTSNSVYGGTFEKMDALIEYWGGHTSRSPGEGHCVSVLKEDAWDTDTPRNRLKKREADVREDGDKFRVLLEELVFPIDSFWLRDRDLTIRFGRKIRERYSNPHNAKHYWTWSHGFEITEIKDKNGMHREYYALYRLPLAVVANDYKRTLEIFNPEVEAMMKSSKQFYNSINGFGNWVEAMQKGQDAMLKICTSLDDSKEIDTVAKGLMCPGNWMFEEILKRGHRNDKQ